MKHDWRLFKVFRWQLHEMKSMWKPCRNFYHLGLINRPWTFFQHEIKTVIGEGVNPTLKDREKLPYTEAALTEVMRVCPTAPTSLRHKTIRDTEIAGYKLPKGTRVCISSSFYQLITVLKILNWSENGLSIQKFFFHLIVRYISLRYLGWLCQCTGMRNFSQNLMYSSRKDI